MKGVPPNPRARSVETDLRNLIDVLPLNVALTDAEGTLLHLNRRVVETTGYTLEDHLVRHAVLKYIHPDDLTRAAELTAQGHARGAPYEFELRHLRRDNRYHWVLVHCTPIRDEDGRIIRWCSTGTDIQQLKQAEEKLRQREQEARQLVDFSPLHITLLGPDGNRIYNNRAALDYYGLTLEDWQGSDTRSLIHPQDAELGGNEVPRKLMDGV